MTQDISETGLNFRVLNTYAGWDVMCPYCYREFPAFKLGKDLAGECVCGYTYPDPKVYG